MEWLLRKNGIDVPSDFSTSFMQFKANGNSGKKYLLDVLKLNNAVAERINSEWIKNIENDNLLVFDCLYSDAISTLDRIRDKGDIISFLTARNNEKGLLEELSRLGLKEYSIDTVVIVPGASKAEAIKAFLCMKNPDDCIERGEGVENSVKTVVVGDTEADYSAAVEADIGCYILNRGFRSKDYWNNLNVTSHENLLELLDLNDSDS